MCELRTFETLECYQLARELRRKISSFSKTLSKKETYCLKDQIVRSARSVAANIAEGYGRHHHQENLQFYRIARGSLSETLEHLGVAFDDGYLDKKLMENCGHFWNVSGKCSTGTLHICGNALNPVFPDQLVNNHLPT